MRLQGIFTPGVGSYGYNDSGYFGSSGSLGLGPVFYTNADGTAAPGDGPGSCRLVREGEVMVPSDMIALADADLYGVPTSSPDEGATLEGFPALGLLRQNILALLSLQSWIVNNADPNIAIGVQNMKMRHYGGWNVGFCDGHVEGLNVAALWYPRDSVTRRWNRDHKPHPETYYGLFLPNM